MLPLLGTIVVALAGLLGVWLTGRNDRAQAHLEIDLLKKLQDVEPESEDVARLRRVVGHRIKAWEAKAIKSGPQRLTLSNIVTVSVLIYLLAVAIVVTLQATGLIEPIVPL